MITTTRKFLDLQTLKGAEKASARRRSELYCILVMMIGMIFIFLTNNWISEVAKEIGPATIQNIDHIYNYADNIRYQADEVFDSYVLVENATTYELQHIGDILGEPMMFHLQEIFDPVFGELMNFEGHMESIRKGLEEISRQNIRLRVRLYLRLPNP